jgi:hypothetical protein
MTVSYADREEGIAPGEGFYVTPGHTPAAIAGTEFVQFSPTDQLAFSEAVMAKNMQEMQGGPRPRIVLWRPKMQEIHGTVKGRVNAAPDATFRLITDIDRLPEWNRAIEHVVERSHELTPGTEWVVKMHPGRGMT